MAFPWIFESNFEAGDASEWDSETDTASQLDFPHFTTLATLPGPAAPYNGAHCMRTTLAGGTADAFVLEGDIDVAAAANRFVKFDIWFSPDFAATQDDVVNFFQLQSAGSTPEATFGARVIAATNAINLGIGEVQTSTFSTDQVERGVWHTVELDVTLDDGVSDDGTIDLYVTREDAPASTSVASGQIASLDQAAVIQGVLGVQDHLATTTGTILFDNFRFDDARIYPDKDRFKLEHLLTKSGHAFVGRGVIQRIDLLSGAATDNVLTVYDTNNADTLDAGNIVAELKNTANNQKVTIDSPLEVHRGAYVVMSGTNPRGLVTIKQNAAGRSISSVRNLGRRQIAS